MSPRPSRNYRRLQVGRSIVLQFDFARRYEVEQLERIERSGIAHVLGFPGAVPLDRQQEMAEGPIVKVSPTEGEPWVGVFHGGQYGSPPAAPGRLLGWPDGRSICVVYTGAGVVVRTDDPHDTFPVESFPITDVVVVPQLELVVFADFNVFAAYGPEGLVWRVGVAGDNARIVSVEADRLLGTGFVTGVEDCPFAVDLLTGEVRDGH